jgi:hypothetical protein
MKLAASLLALVFCARVATAQPAMTQPAPAAVSEDGDLSPATAVLLSAGATVASWSVMLAAASDDSGRSDSLVLVGALGTLVAPSLGHWYARDYLTAGMGLRAVGAAAMIGGVFAAFDDLFEDDRDDSAADTAIVLGVIAYGAGTIYDIATAGRAAQRYNDQRHHLALAPVVNPTTGSYGVALGGRF